MNTPAIVWMAGIVVLVAAVTSIGKRQAPSNALSPGLKVFVFIAVMVLLLWLFGGGRR